MSQILLVNKEKLFTTHNYEAINALAEASLRAEHVQLPTQTEQQGISPIIQEQRRKSPMPELWRN